MTAPGDDLAVRWYARPLPDGGVDVRVALADQAGDTTRCPVCDTEGDLIGDEVLRDPLWSCRACGTRWAIARVIDLLYGATLHGLARWRAAHPGQLYPGGWSL